MCNIGIIGVGAIGGMLASFIYPAYKGNTYIIASGARYERLARSGIHVNGKLLRPRIIESDADAVAIDVLLVCVKNYDLDSAMIDIGKVINTRTIILPFLNGLEATAKLKKAFPENKVLYGIAIRTDALRENNTMSFSSAGELQIGDETNTPPSGEVTRIKNILSGAGLTVNIYDDMKRMLWRKIMLNIGVNQISAVTERTFKRYKKIDEIVELFRNELEEILLVARAEGVHVTEHDIDEIVETLINYPPDKKTSMLQDIEAHRKTEIDYFAGEIIKLGTRHGIPTPVNQTMYLIIKAKEKYYVSASNNDD
jgi:2-dehydropantoate 2-reductase